ncbi:hypothetical protein BFF78_01025 [Streptomyces fodineus]|uniref:Uncharacterized protein n=1 Tax=Streptomyces fodineus TaxID=1904616 RepID=A0A1D7Y2P0_9ACTN|nr:hypothetical protein BFF78_01025 [Streptomyces fodineus]
MSRSWGRRLLVAVVGQEEERAAGEEPGVGIAGRAWLEVGVSDQASVARVAGLALAGGDLVQGLRDVVEVFRVLASQITSASSVSSLSCSIELIVADPPVP